MPTVQIKISGKVQGVFYRASAKKIAEQLQLTGYIKNMPNGDVFSVATGTDECLNQFINWCKKGPSAAKVQLVEFTPITYQSFEQFQIIR